jgi:uncharacterized protein YcgL (UPF0745 family)
LQDVTCGKNIVDLYPKVLTEVPMSSSCFQDKCVQYEEHHTPHRKLRQAMLEMQNRLNSLDSAKNGYKRAIGRIEKVNRDIEHIKNLLNSLESFDKKYCDINKHKMDCLLYLSEKLTNLILSINSKDDFSYIVPKLIEELESVLWDKTIEQEELTRNLNSAEHMVKDAIIKVVQQKKLTNTFIKEVEDLGISFEASEMIYYIMYFTYEAEKQLMTMGRLDTGTCGVIRQLPDKLSNKVLENIEFIKKHMNEGGYVTKKYKNILYPKITGNDEIEGLNIKDFIGIDVINTLSNKEQ